MSICFGAKRFEHAFKATCCTSTQEGPSGTKQSHVLKTSRNDSNIANNNNNNTTNKNNHDTNNLNRNNNSNIIDNEYGKSSSQQRVFGIFPKDLRAQANPRALQICALSLLCLTLRFNQRGVGLTDPEFIGMH